MSKFYNKKAYLSTLFLLSSVLASAANFTGAVNSDWSNSGNWDTGIVPIVGGTDESAAIYGGLVTTNNTPVEVATMYYTFMPGNDLTFKDSIITVDSANRTDDLTSQNYGGNVNFINTDLTSNGSWIRVYNSDTTTPSSLNITEGSNIYFNNLYPYGQGSTGRGIFESAGGDVYFNITDSKVNFNFIDSDAVDSNGGTWWGMYYGKANTFIFNLDRYSTEAATATMGMLVDNSTFITDQENFANFGQDGTLNLILSNAGQYIAPAIEVRNDNGFDLTDNLTINIGSLSGDAPVAPGSLVLENALLNLPYGATINFNHTSTDASYTFTPSIQQGSYKVFTSDGNPVTAVQPTAYYDINVNALAGYTNLGGADSNYYGTTTVSSGATLKKRSST